MKYTYDYPMACVTADVALFKFIWLIPHVLLVQRNEEPFKDQWALPGGHLEVNSDWNLAVTAKRELQEETGIKPIGLEQFQSYSDIDRDPRGRYVTVLFYACTSNAKPVAASDAGQARFVPLHQALKMKLAFNHNEMLRDLVWERLYYIVRGCLCATILSF